MYKDITAISVVCNTRDLIERMYTSFRKFHPDIKMIILDNSDIDHDCQKYLNTINTYRTTIYRFGTNHGHARAVNFGLTKVTTRLALLMDSDTVMLRSPLQDMLKLMKDDSYGAGWITEIGRDGYDFGTYRSQRVPIKYLHPYFCLLNVDEFRKYPPLVHHGNPFVSTMVKLHDLGLSGKLVSFPGLTGHTNGQGSNWVGTPSEYIQHDFGGTRNELRKCGREEIEGRWEY